jgi:uncharacterized membrane protein YhaH (DUF805 family)
VFIPIYISKYKIFNKIKKYNDFISIAINYILLNILLIIIDNYCFINGYASSNWYFNLALPISLICYLILNIMLCVRFMKTNKLLKTSFILYFINLLYLIIPFIKTKNQTLQHEINGCNIFKADFSHWQINVTLESNIHLIIFLTLLGIASIFLIFGLIKHLRNKNKISKM